ncbi:MAG: uroporphyrinogen-III synthase [Coriobacteriia bacterium]|nr:uroporphyrinogen-III synthase [Coriobacteriia bacterium]
MKAQLESAGFQVIVFPTIALSPPPDASIIESAITHLGAYAWVIFTSANAVDAFFDYYHELRGTLDEFFQQEVFPRIAVVGPATAEALKKYDMTAELMAVDFQAEGLVDAFAQLPAPQREGRAVLIPRALEARDVLENELPALGFEVTVAPVYQTVTATASAESIAEISQAGSIVFTSPSTVKNFIKILDAQQGQGAGIDYLSKRTTYSIGPVTTAELKEKTLPRQNIIEAAPSTSAALVAAIISN